MSYQVLARKWRPQTFDEMVGQDFISRTLKNAVRTGRVAHAFLFTGSRGVGKTSAARILAKCLNCDQGPAPTPCNDCPSCKEITEGRSLDVYEIDGASNTSVDDIRELRENVKYLPRPGKRRVYIIDEVHMLSKSAFNALLKTLEEPPEHVVFIFATTEPHKVPETIQSRCQRFDFRRIPRAKILGRLQEMAKADEREIDDRALAAVAKAADGSMRDAQSLLDQIISYCEAEVTNEAVADILGIAGREYFFRISEAILGQDPKGCIEALDDIYRSGYDINQFYQDLAEHFRNLLVARLLPDPASVLEMADAEIQELKKQAEQASPEDLRRLVSILLKAEEDVLRSQLPRMGMEITLIKMAHLGRLEPLEKILAKITAFEQTMRGRPATSRGGSPIRPSSTKARQTASGQSATKADGGTRKEARNTIKRPSKPQEPSLATRAGTEEEIKDDVPKPEGTPSPSPVIPWNAPDAWQSFVETVRQDRAMTAALLEDVDQWELNEDAVKVFCEKGSFLYEQLGTPAMRTQLSRSAIDCFGGTIRFELCTKERLNDSKAQTSGRKKEEETRARQSPPAVEEAQDDRAVKTALEVFHGTIKDVKLFGADQGEEEETES
jgi:DNA polymerase-3 subunit gamma/tau